MSRKNNPAAPPCARLLKIEIPHTAWVNLTAVTRRLLRVPIAWRKRKSGDRPLRLRWKNRAQGNSRASNVHDTKAAAQAAGREMARDRGVEHVIKRMDGTIGEKNSYGKDSYPPKG